MTTEILLPIKSLHSSNFETLQNEYITAMDSIRNSIESIMKIDFNSRDYASMIEYQSAKKQRIEMLEKMNEVYEYLETIAIALN